MPNRRFPPPCYLGDRQRGQASRGIKHQADNQHVRTPDKLGLDRAAADHARYFRAAPNNIRVVTNVDHNVHTIPRDSRSCTNSRSLSYVGQKHRLLPFSLERVDPDCERRADPTRAAVPYSVIKPS
jgi:hypothetical protein